MTTRTFIATALFAVLVTCVAPVVVLAKDAGPVTVSPDAGSVKVPSGNVTLVNPLKGVDCSSGNGNCLMAFLQAILDFVVQIGVIVIILMVVYTGFKFVMARGNSTEIVKAREALFWTVVGALILLGAKAIALAIQATVATLGG